MQPPSANPSKNWWNDNAPIKGFMVHGLCETPSESPMMIECETIPTSNTCKRYIADILNGSQHFQSLYENHIYEIAQHFRVTKPCKTCHVIMS